LFRFRLSSLLLLAGLIALPGLQADTVRGKNGDVLHGKLISETPDEIVFESALTGRIALPRSAIDSIEVDPLPDLAVAAKKSEELPWYFRASLEAVAAPIFQPSDEKFDWIQLTSGEWLKGELRAVYHNLMEFDSDELDVLEIDWDKVERMRTSQPFSVRIDSENTRTGPLTLHKGQIAIGDGTPAQIGQYKLISIAPEASGRLSGWTSKLGLATTLRGGVSTQRDIDINAVIQRRTAKRRLYADFLSSYSEVEGLVTTNSIRSKAYFDLLRSRRTFVRPISIEYFRDPLQNINRRITYSASYGYYIIDDRKNLWDISVGPAYQTTTYINTDDGQPRQAQEPALLISSQLDLELTKRLDLTGNYSVQWASNTDGAIYHTLTKLEYELTRYLDLDLSLVWDRIEDQGDDTAAPTDSNNDVRLTIGIGLDY
jgi:hypothetical protein